MLFQNVIELLVSFVEMAFGIALLATSFERRPHMRWRSALAGTGVFLGATALVRAASLVHPDLQDTWHYDAPLAAGGGAALWLVVPITAALLVHGLREADAWASIFCAAAGYAIQNLASSLADAIELILGSGDVSHVGLLPTLVIEAATCAATYLPFWYLFAKPVRTHGLAHEGDRGMLVLLATVFFAVILFDTINKGLAAIGTPLDFVLGLKAVHAVVCAFVLVSTYEFLVARQARERSAAAQSMLAMERRQYELSRQNIEAINVKCHDIRHQIRALASGGAIVDKAVLDDIAHEVSVYDSQIRTGNDALDTVLSEKGLVCEREGINLRCIADGTAVGFMAPTDIYALFGNALENAIEASRALSDPAERSIGLTIREVAGMASIHVENRFAGELRLDADGLPRSSKADAGNHGIGTRSMRLTAERYGGTLAVSAQNGTFHLNIAIPLPE